MTQVDPTSLPYLPYRPCVGIVLVNNSGGIFCGERLDTPGAWQMPQGGIDADETPETAALRELEEETGVTADLVTIDGVTPEWLTYDLPDHLVARTWGGRYRGQKQLWYLMRFHGQDSDIDIGTKHPEFGLWRWSTKAEVIRDIVPFKQDLYREVLQHFVIA